MKGVSGATLADVFKASLAFCLLNCVAMALFMAVPATTTWLPSLMK